MAVAAPRPALLSLADAALGYLQAATCRHILTGSVKPSGYRGRVPKACQARVQRATNIDR